MIKLGLERRDWILLFGALISFGCIWLAVREINWMVVHPSFLTGYILAILALSLGFLAIRKRLPGLPIGSASTWLKVHVTSGVVLLFVFWLHLGTIWPSGPFEQIFALSFYLLIGSGLVGRLLQKGLPLVLASTGGEVILERIPREVIRIREQIEDLLIECSAETGELSLALAYEESLAWYFRRPRFVLSSIFGLPRGRHWFNNQAAILERSLSSNQQPYLDQVKILASRKYFLDQHYALQNILKYWLFLHIPAAVFFYVFAIWHTVLVHIYAQ